MTIPIPFDFDNAGNVNLSDEDRELAAARSVILKKLCVENGIPPHEALVAVAVFIGDLLKHQSELDASNAVGGLYHLTWDTYLRNRKGNGQ